MFVGKCAPFLGWGYQVDNIYQILEDPNFGSVLDSECSDDVCGSNPKNSLFRYILPAVVAGGAVGAIYLG